MSELYNRIERMCKERGTNITALCRDAKVARASLSELKAGRTKTLTLETGAKLASVLGISVDELMDRRDVAKLVENIMSDMEQAGDLNFDGMPMSEEARAAMASAMRIGLEEARRRNKETYTPKKYRKG